MLINSFANSLVEDFILPLATVCFALGFVSRAHAAHVDGEESGELSCQPFNLFVRRFLFLFRFG